MKIKPEHYKYVSDKIAEKMTALGITLQTIHAMEQPKLYAYQVFMTAISGKWVRDSLYSYCNDDHIDTVIRKIFQLKK